MIVLRTPCQVHEDCDETSVRMIHGRKFASLSEKEMDTLGHMGCEGMLSKIKETLLSGRTYRCSCGVIITLDENKKLSPPLAIVYPALEVKS